MEWFGIGATVLGILWLLGGAASWVYVQSPTGWCFAPEGFVIWLFLVPASVTLVVGIVTLLFGFRVNESARRGRDRPVT